MARTRTTARGVPTTGAKRHRATIEEEEKPLAKAKYRRRRIRITRSKEPINKIFRGLYKVMADDQHLHYPKPVMLKRTRIIPLWFGSLSMPQRKHIKNVFPKIYREILRVYREGKGRCYLMLSPQPDAAADPKPESPASQQEPATSTLAIRPKPKNQNSEQESATFTLAVRPKDRDAEALAHLLQEVEKLKLDGKLEFDGERGSDTDDGGMDDNGEDEDGKVSGQDNAHKELGKAKAKGNRARTSNLLIHQR
ncbi:MAG: hypothetical protein MMC23_007843 [Stictis urceolatum]|nr:hypothetical protein [Stictis urceolata]